MEILNTTITARASANYQVGEVSIQIANYTEEELSSIQRYTVDKAVHICNELQAKATPNTTPVQPTVSTNVQQFPPKKTPTYRTDGNYQQPQASVQNTQPQVETKYVNGAQYKKCKNKTTGEIFWCICDLNLISNNTPKYIKD